MLAVSYAAPGLYGSLTSADSAVGYFILTLSDIHQHAVFATGGKLGCDCAMVELSVLYRISSQFIHFVVPYATTFSSSNAAVKMR